MLLDTSNPFLWTGCELAILDDDHSNIHVFACPRDVDLPNSSYQAPRPLELLSIEHILSIPVYQYAQVSLVPTVEKDIASISLLINESMLIVVDRCGGLLRLYAEEHIGYAFAEICSILRLTETRYLLFTTNDIVDLDLESHTSQVYVDVGSSQILHMSDDPMPFINGPALNINPKYVYGPKHLHVLVMVSSDIYLLKIYDINTRRLICQIYFYERIVSLQELPGAGNIVVTDTGKIYQVHFHDDVVACSGVALKGFDPTQNIEKFLVLPHYAAVETETRMQYLYSITWEQGVLTFNHLLWSDDASLAPSAIQERFGSVSQSRDNSGAVDLLSLIASLCPVPRMTIQQTSLVSESNTDTAMSPSVLSSTRRVLSAPCKASPDTPNSGVLGGTPTLQVVSDHKPACARLLLKSLVIHVSNNTNALLFVLDGGFVLSPLTGPTSGGASFIIREESGVIFSEVLSALIGREMPLNAILNVTVFKASSYGFVFRLLNLSTGSSFDFPFTSTSLARLTQGSSREQPVFRAYSVFSVEDYIVTWLLAGSVCFGFYLSFKTRTCLTAELQLEGEAYFSYPLVRPLYRPGKTEESRITGQYILTYYILEVHGSADTDPEEPGAQAVAGQRTLLSLFVSTRTHVLTELSDATFQITEIATITPISIQYELLLQGQSKLLRAMTVPYLILSESSFILITETTSETCFYLFVLDAHRGTADVSLLEHDIALGFLCDHNDSLGQFGYARMGTFHLSGLVDFYISGILRQRLNDRITKHAASVDALGDRSLGSVSGPTPTSMESSGTSLKGTVESFLMHRQPSRDPEVSVVGAPTIQHLLESIPADAHSIIADGSLASMNDQIERLVIDKQYNPYVSLSAAKKHKKVRRALYVSVDNDTDMSDDLLSESSATRGHALSAHGSQFHDDGMTSAISLKRKLDTFKRREGYAGEYAIRPLKGKLCRFLRLCVNISSVTSKQSIDYRAELESIDNILKELAASPRPDRAGGARTSLSIPMTPGWVDMMISRFALRYPATGVSTEAPASPRVCQHASSTVVPMLQQERNAIARLLSDGLHPELESDDDESSSGESAAIHVSAAPRFPPKHAATGRMLDAMCDAAVSPAPSLLETVVGEYLPSDYYSLDSLGFLQVYNSTQRILATILITPLKRLYHNIFMVMAQKDGLITEDLRNRLRLGRASASACQHLDFFASDLLNCREVVNCLLAELTPDHLYNHNLSFTLSCLSVLVVAGVLYRFLQEADRRPFLSAVDAALGFVVEGYLRANPGHLPSLRLVLPFLVIGSPFSKFAAVAFLRLLTARLSKLLLEEAIPKNTLDTLVLATAEVCELGFRLTLCTRLPPTHVLVLHRELFHKAVLAFEALAFMKDPALSGRLGLGERAAALLDATLGASAALVCCFRNSLADANLKRFSPGFASYFLANLAFLLHTVCTCASVAPALMPPQCSTVLLKTVALQELVGASPALISCCRGISGYYRGLCASSSMGTPGRARESEEPACRCHLHESFFEDARRLLSEPPTTLSIRSLYVFVRHISRHEQGVWRRHSTRFIQLLICLMQRLSALNRTADRQAEAEPLTTLPLEKSMLDRDSLLASLRECLFDLSYSLPPIALVRLTAGNDISVLHGFTPGFLTIKFLESSTQALNLQKPLVLEQAYSYFLEHKAERYQLSMLPSLGQLSGPLLGVPSDTYKAHGRVLPCISFISVDPQNEFALVYCHNYNALLVYRLSSNIDDVYLVGTGSTDLFAVISPGSQTLLAARVVWAEVRKAMRSYKLCEVHFVHGDSPQSAASTEECIWKTTRHEKPVKHLALFSVEDEQEEYEHRQQEEHRTDAKDSVPKPDRRQSYLVTQEKTTTKETTTVKLKIKRVVVH
ncbi:Hypothetical protein GLP15_4482 [Giardia lamblia P15]|uniref:Uncharacterized protein n=1 Tax=Giardia intestinalis (strain P15) TaxID=658858 RepID=E1F810_GIAIA|nr:Hypothetical protein GLP15_4482 [Giardia lamblia P15]